MAFRKEALSGVSWNSAVKITDIGLQFIRIMVLARFLEREEFGLLAIINLVLGFTSIFTDLGLTVAILHKQDTTQKQYSSLYWFNWFLNIGIFLILIGSAPFVADFYEDPRLFHLIVLMGIRILIGPIGKIFWTIKTKNLEFAFISKVQIISHVLGFALVIAMLLIGLGIYSVIYSSLISALLSGLIFSFAGRKQFRIQLHYKFSEIKDYFRIGAYEQGKQILDYIAYRIDILLIGRFFGMDDLGIYNLGKELILKPMKMINPIITQVATPIFAKLQGDAEAFKKNYIRVLNVLGFINFPILAILFILAEPITAVVYGKNLMDVAIFVQIMSLWGIFATIGNPAGILTVAKGRTDLSFKWTIVRVATAPIAIYIASFYSIEAVAYSQVILQVIFFWFYWRILIYPLSGILFRNYVGAVSSALISSLMAVGSVFILQLLYKGEILENLIFGLLLFSLVYLGATFVMNRQIISLARSMILKKNNS